MIRKWIESLIDNNKQSAIISKYPEPTVCLNFIKVPDYPAIALTVTFVSDNKKRASLSPVDFAFVMRVLENDIKSAYMNDLSMDRDREYYTPVSKDICSISKYTRLNCHRLFFIPESELFNTLSSFINLNTFKAIATKCKGGVTCNIDTDDYKFSVYQTGEYL